MRQTISELFIDIHFIFQHRTAWRNIKYRGKMLIDPRDRHDRLFKSRRFELDLETFFLNFIKVNDVIIDCGAQKGYFTLLFSKLVKSAGKILAIEADPRSFEKLQNNLTKNAVSNVVALNNLISSERKSTDFFLSKTIGHSSIYPSDLAKTYIEDRIKINAETLDGLIESTKFPSGIALIKMDIEGAEFTAMQGMKKTLARGPALLFEVNNHSLSNSNTTPEQIQSYLKEYGYSFYSISFHRNLFLRPKITLKKILNIPNKGMHDIIAVTEGSDGLKRISDLIC